MGYHMSDLLIRFLYQTIPGRILLKGLVSSRVSRAAGNVLSSNPSRLIVPWYIRKHRIDMKDIDIPSGGFSSFNDFFTRKRVSITLPDSEENPLVSPCDGLLSVVRIGENGALFSIKHTTYSLQQLLDSPMLTERLKGGTALIIRLTPQHYHRYCYSAEGEVTGSVKIKGKLHCVRPAALETVPVFVQNSREYQVIQTPQQTLIVQMEVGALLVGKISNRPVSAENRKVYAGMEKGYFEFGGSTIILLLEKDKIHLHREIEIKALQGEVPVHIGQLLGKMLL